MSSNPPPPIQPVSPLNWRVPIVNPDGTPCPQFIRLWQSMFGNGENSNALLQELVAAELQAGAGITITPDGHLLSNPTISADLQALLDAVTTTQGSILFRGASEWQFLGPGTSGQFLETQGAGADPVWAAAGGGGGGGYFNGSSGNLGVVSTTSIAVKGIIFVPSSNLTLAGINALLQASAAGQAHYAQVLLTSGTTVSSVVATSTAVNSTGTTQDYMHFPLSASLTSGNTYALVVENRSGSGTTSLRLMGGDTLWPNAPGKRSLTSVNYSTANSLSGGETLSTVSGGYAVWPEGNT